MSKVKIARNYQRMTQQVLERPLKPDRLPESLEPLPGLFQRVDLRERRLRPEWMDQAGVDPLALDIAHRSLELYNWLSFTHSKLWSPIYRLAQQRKASGIRVLDVGCGGGDLAIKLAQTAQHSGLNVTIDGCDLSTTAVALATRRAEDAGVPCRFFAFDVGHDVWPHDYDVICSSLFLHHLPTCMIETVMGCMARAAKEMVLINDLMRSRIGYLILRIGTLIMTRSPLARYDGPISVAGAFTPDEFRQMAIQAGLTGATVKRCWPERMQLVWKKS